jgi:hypothetical protein
LFIELSSALRRLTGTDAISAFFGSASRSLRNGAARLAAHRHHDGVDVPPTACRAPSSPPAAATASLYERWLVIESLKIVFGAMPRFRLRSPVRAGAMRRPCAAAGLQPPWQRFSASLRTAGRVGDRRLQQLGHAELVVPLVGLRRGGGPRASRRQS